MRAPRLLEHGPGVREALVAHIRRAGTLDGATDHAWTVLPDYAPCAERPLVDLLVRQGAVPRDEVLHLFPDEPARRADLAYWLARAFGWREKRLSGAFADAPDPLEPWLDGLLQARRARPGRQAGAVPALRRGLARQRLRLVRRPRPAPPATRSATAPRPPRSAAACSPAPAWPVRAVRRRTATRSPSRRCWAWSPTCASPPCACSRPPTSTARCCRARRSARSGRALRRLGRAGGVDREAAGREPGGHRSCWTAATPSRAR